MNKKFRFIKKVFVVVLLILSIGIQGITANASDKEYKKLEELTFEEITTAALNFAKDFCELPLEIGEIIPIYNYDYQLIGYSVSYIHDNISYGYIDFDFTNEEFINDFSIQEEALSPLESLSKRVLSFCQEYEVEKILLKGNYLEYTIVLTDINGNKYYYSRENGIISSDGFKEKADELRKLYGDLYSSGTVYGYINAIFSNSYISGSTVLEGPTYMQKFTPSLSALSQSLFETLNNRYACAVAALTEIAAQEGILVTGYSNLDDRIMYTFDALWSFTNTYVDHSSNGYDYGFTYDSDIGPGMLTHCYDMGKYSTVYNTTTSPSYTFYKTAVTDNASSTFSYRIYYFDGSTKVSAHTVNVVGYCKASYSGSVSYYLIVANGWDYATTQYINISNVDFIDNYGVRFYIS